MKIVNCIPAGLLAACLALLSVHALDAQAQRPPIIRGPQTAAATAVDPDSPQGILLDDLNATRQSHGLLAMHLNAELSVAAQRHADLMAAEDTLEHQLPHEAGLAERCAAAGAHFASIAENIATGSALHRIHDGWVHSPPHYENMMTPAFTAVGIGIARRGRTIYAVEDFSMEVAVENTATVEQRVRDMLAVRNINPGINAEFARNACESGERQYSGAGPHPAMVIQFASPDVEKLGPILDEKIHPGRYQSASVGACTDVNGRGFTRYRVTLLLY